MDIKNNRQLLLPTGTQRLIVKSLTQAHLCSGRPHSHLSCWRVGAHMRTLICQPAAKERKNEEWHANDDDYTGQNSVIPTPLCLIICT